MNKILVFEAEPLLLELLAELLSLHGFDTFTTTSSEQGYELTKREKPQLILCGYSSKDPNRHEICWTFLQKIRQDLETANIPFILMSGTDLETIPQWQNYLTSEEILLKPFNSQVLLEKIYTHLPFSRIKSKIDQSPKLSNSKNYREFIHQNDFFTKENQATYQYSYIFA